MAALVNIGKPVARIEGPAKVTGRTRYTADVSPPGVLWGKCLRSPYPHARIVRIDASRATSVPGVHAVITAADLPDVRTGRAIMDHPVLARDVVRFVGERVAAVAAESLDAAERALDLIEVEYEPLPAVFDPVEALREDAPIIHPDAASYEVLPEPFLRITSNPPPHPNAMAYLVYRRGDLAAGFAQADRVFEHTFRIPAVHQGYLEPHTCLVDPERDGKINLYCNNKSPFAARAQLARAIGVAEERVRVHVMPIGGDFGGKGSLMDAVTCCHLALRSGRPVKMVMSYSEDLMAANPRHGLVITLRTGVTNEGHITARQARLVFNSGAYGAFRRSITLPNNRAAVSSYRIPNMELESLCVYTNTVPRGYMRAPGGPQVTFGSESHLDMIAHGLGMDPLELRRRNLLEAGEESPVGLSWEDIRVKEVLEAAAQAIGWDAPKAPNVGRGIALFNKEPRPWPAEATVRVERDGNITLMTAVPDTGAGAHTVFQQIVAEALVPLERVSVVAGNTDTAPYDAGIGASRVTHTAGQATFAASELVREQVLERAAALMEQPREALRLEAGRILAKDGQEMSLAELASGGRDTIEAIGRDRGDEGPGATSFCVQAAEVEVDRETGQVHVRRMVSAHDVATVLNPLLHQGQIDGAVVQGFGQGVMEHLEIEDGAVSTLHLGDYKLPSIMDVPPLDTVLVPTTFGELPYDGKHIGELSNVPMPAAIANAVFDAVGVRLMDLPVTAEKVYDRLNDSGAK